MNQIAQKYNVNTNLNDLEKEIYKAVKEIAVTFLANKASGIKWTEKIKTDIGLIGVKHQFLVDSSCHEREWMYDLVWSKRSIGKLESINLVLESELNDRPGSINQSELLRDFEKLLLANVETKVMICFNEGNFKYPENVDRTLNLFKDTFNVFMNHRNGSRLLLIIIDDYHSGDVIPHVFEPLVP